MPNSNGGMPLFLPSRSSWQPSSQVATDQRRLANAQQPERQPSQAKRKCNCFARYFAAEKTFSRVAGKAAGQERLAIRRLVRTNGTRCSVGKEEVQEAPERQIASNAVSMRSFESLMRKSRSISRAFRFWGYIRFLWMRRAGFWPRTSTIAGGRTMSLRSVKRVVHTTFLSQSSDHVPVAALTLGASSLKPFLRPREEFGVFPDNRIYGASPPTFDVVLRSAFPKPGYAPQGWLWQPDCSTPSTGSKGNRQFGIH